MDLHTLCAVRRAFSKEKYTPILFYVKKTLYVYTCVAQFIVLCEENIISRDLRPVVKGPSGDGVAGAHIWQRQDARTVLHQQEPDIQRGGRRGGDQRRCLRQQHFDIPQQPRGCCPSQRSLHYAHGAAVAHSLRFYPRNPGVAFAQARVPRCPPVPREGGRLRERPPLARPAAPTPFDARGYGTDAEAS